MNSPVSTLTLNLPIKLDAEEAKLMIFLSLFGKGAISSGKACEYLGIKRTKFLEDANSYGISILSDNEDNLADALEIEL